MGYVLGVDLGTTFTAAAIGRGGDVDVVSLGDRAPAIPSIVLLRADGEVLVGEAAERRGLSEPTRTAREFKRRLGDPVPLLLGGTPYGAESLMAHLLRWVAERVSAQEGDRPDLVVVSHPASYGSYKKDLLVEAVRQAGVENVEFISEPEGAAVHYSQQERIEPGDTVAVYDFGGGTFDAAVLRKTDAGFELLGTPEGMERLGGIDFDHAVFAHVDASLDGAVSAIDPADSTAIAAVVRLREECRAAKEALSADTDATIAVLVPGLQSEVRLTRPEFENMIRPRVLETIGALERAVASTGLGVDDISRILLVGGSSRIPLVAQVVGERTGRPVAVDAHPKFAIARGAALLGLAATGQLPVAAAEADASSVEDHQDPSWNEPTITLSPVAARDHGGEAEDAPDSPDKKKGGRAGTFALVALAAVVALIIGVTTVTGGGKDEAQVELTSSNSKAPAAADQGGAAPEGEAAAEGTAEEAAADGDAPAGGGAAAPAGGTKSGSASGGARAGGGATATTTASGATPSGASGTPTAGGSTGGSSGGSTDGGTATTAAPVGGGSSGGGTTATTTAPAVRPMVFQRDGNIFRMNPDGSGLKQLTTGGGAGGPSLSPDGTKVLYAQSVPGSTEVMVMTIEGTGATNLTANQDSHCGQPDWSPDGSMIAYYRYGDIWTMKADGSDKVQRTTGSITDGLPDWSPDGTKIAFVRWTDGATRSIQVLNVGDHALTQVIASTAGVGETVAWSPNGSKLLYSVNGQLFTVSPTANATGTGLPATGGYAAAMWSPDGTKIVAVKGGDLYVMSSAGTGATAVATDGTNGDPDWY